MEVYIDVLLPGILAVFPLIYYGVVELRYTRYTVIICGVLLSIIWVEYCVWLYSLR